jgi:hypothetical protein
MATFLTCRCRLLAASASNAASMTDSRRSVAIRSEWRGEGADLSVSEPHYST